jgi:hypothetical protein
MKTFLLVVVSMSAAACAQPPLNAGPSTGAGHDFRTGLCPSDVPMPDTLAPLKVAPARVGWADESYQPAIAAYGHLVARITIDVTGRVEPGSAVIVTSDSPELSVAYCRDLPRQRFVPYRVGEEARAVRVDQDFRMIRRLGR